MQPVGSPWTREHKGVDADAIRGHALKEGISFCRRAHLKMASRYEIILFQEHGAAIMARAWASRMQWRLDNEDVLHENQQRIMWDEPSEFTLFAAQNHVKKQIHKRIAEIRVL